MSKKQDDFPHHEIEVVEEWAKSKIREGGKAPWVWYRLWQLRDAIEGCRRSLARDSIPSDLRGSVFHESGSSANERALILARKPRGPQAGGSTMSTNVARHLLNSSDDLRTLESLPDLSIDSVAEIVPSLALHVEIVTEAVAAGRATDDAVVSADA